MYDGLQLSKVCYNSREFFRIVGARVEQRLGLKVFFWVCTLLPILSGCSGSAPPTDFLDEGLTGKITGKEWEFAYGYVDPTIETPEENDMVIILLPFKPKERCPQGGDSHPDQRSVMVSVPLVKKVTQLKSGSNRNAVFHTVAKGKTAASVVKSGKVKLDVISGKKIQGRLFARMNDINWVSGKFSAEVCDYADFQ
jgi:hypothetical protein